MKKKTDHKETQKTLTEKQQERVAALIAELASLLDAVLVVGIKKAPSDADREGIVGGINGKGIDLAYALSKVIGSNASGPLGVVVASAIGAMVASVSGDDKAGNDMHGLLIDTFNKFTDLRKEEANTNTVDLTAKFLDKK